MTAWRVNCVLRTQGELQGIHLALRLKIIKKANVRLLLKGGRVCFFVNFRLCCHTERPQGVECIS